MKILLDECITKHLKKYLLDFEVYTIKELNLIGIKNGKLLSYSVENNFDILLTIDKNMQFQQNLEKYPIAIVVLNAYSNSINELISFIPSFKLQVKHFKKYTAYIIDK